MRDRRAASRAHQIMGLNRLSWVVNIRGGQLSQVSLMFSQAFFQHSQVRTADLGQLA